MIDNIKTVGADPSVCPLEHKNKFDNTLNIKGRTHGSAPTQYKYNRCSLRLKHYDYTRAGYYFITVCAQNREHLFGEIVDGVMDLNVVREMVESWYMKLEEKFPNVRNHEIVIMPNHIHFIMEIIQPVGADPCVRPIYDDISLGDVVQWFKTMTTNNTYIKMVKNGTLPPFNKRIWQRNYYEHVIRDEADYERVATYTMNNPTTWHKDTLNT